MRGLALIAVALVLGTVAAEADLNADVSSIRGFNLGNALEAPNEGEWGVTLQSSYFNEIAKAGFNTVRLPVRWNAHAAKQAPYTIDPKFLARVDWAVSEAKKNRLRVIIDFHNDDDAMKVGNPAQDQFVGIWSELAAHYAAEPVDQVWFELMNEPNGMKAEDWNSLAAKALEAARKGNETRPVVVGPVDWNSIRKLKDLVLPKNDAALVVTVHYYDPMTFTHQGAEWVEGSSAWMGNRWMGTDAERATVDKAMTTVADWGKAQNRPMYLGEFGAYSKGKMEDRARWTDCVARTAEKHGIGWTYWEFCSGFGAYDPEKNQWREALEAALLGK